MAKVSVITPAAVPPPKKVVLELSLEEASTLLQVMGRVGGSPSHSRRGHTNAIYTALVNEPAIKTASSVCVGTLSYRDEPGLVL